MDITTSQPVGDPRRENSLYYCLKPGCGGWLAVIVQDGRAIEAGGALIEHRVALKCRRCGVFRTWCPRRPVDTRQDAAA